MITAYLQGGLGNQMFQIAAAYALANRNNDTAIFNFDSCHTPLQGCPSNKYKNNLFRNYEHSDKLNIENYYRELKFSYQNIPYKQNMQLQGYFQSEKYFLDYADEIISKFYWEPKIVNQVFEFIYTLPNTPLIGVHVRRGDYLNNPQIHPTCSLQYYQEAIRIFEKEQKCSFIVVSDDIEWVKQYFVCDDIIFYSPFTDELSDLLLLSSLDHNIIANSSFSWWGAYLNKNENKKVIAPKIWFGPNGPQDQFDIIPERWVKI